MPRRQFLHHIRHSLRSQPPPRSSIPTPSTAVPASPPSTTDASQIPASHPPLSPSLLFPIMRVCTEKSPQPRPVYVSLSTDLRLLYATPSSAPPASLLNFRSPDIHLPLHRMPSTPAQSPLTIVVAQHLRSSTHPSGPALSVTDGSTTILLISTSPAERDAFLTALRLRVAPWPALRQAMSSEVRDVAVAATLFVPDLRDGGRGRGEEEPERRAASAAGRVWARAGSVAETALWAATLGQGVGSVVRGADGFERLAAPLGGLAVVGCAFSVVALSARLVGLIAGEREGRERLLRAREGLREASVAIIGWVVQILETGFTDEAVVGGVFDVLFECWEGVGRLERYVLGTWARRVWNAAEVGIIMEMVENIKGKLSSVGLVNIVAEHERRITDVESQVQCFPVDDFRSCVPDPLELNAGLVTSAATSLLPLKNAVLRTCASDELTGSTVAGPLNHPDFDLSAPSLRRVVLLSLDGEGGVGESSTCKLLCADADVQSHFADGAVLWIDVGRGASGEAVESQLVDIVFTCGGERSAEKMTSSGRGIRAAVVVARKFFSEHRLLVVVDNVWETEVGSSVSSWAEELSKIASCPGSAVLVTSRSRKLMDGLGFDHFSLSRFDLIEHDSADWSIAESLFDVLLRATPTERLCEDYKANRRFALELSGGLPLIIRTFASLVRNRLRIGDNVESILEKIERKSLALGGRATGDELCTSIRHPGLFALIEENLQFLDERKGSRLALFPSPKVVSGNDVFRSTYPDPDGKLTFRSLYAALAVMPISSPKLSLHVLSLLWHLSTVADAEEIALIFADAGLGTVDRGRDLEQGKYFHLHDLQYEYCVSVCGQGSDSADVGHTGSRLVNGHALFLSSCELLLEDALGESADGSAWVDFCLEGGDLNCPSHSIVRGYLTQNVFRHLSAAAAVAGVPHVRRIMVGMLFNFRWLRARMSADGRFDAVADCFHALDMLKRFSNHPGNMPLFCNTIRTIRLLRQGMMRVGDGVKERDGALASSLAQVSQSRVDVEGANLDASLLGILSRSVERHVYGPWLKPIFGCARIPASDRHVFMEASVGSGDRLMSIAVVGEGHHVMTGSCDGVVRVHESRDLETVLTLRGHTSDVSCVASAKSESSNSAFFMFSGSYDGDMRCWVVDLKTSRSGARYALAKSSAIVGECGRQLWCLSLSKFGSVIAAGSETGELFVWKRVGPEEAPSFELLTSTSCVLGSIWTSGVVGVAVSPCGDVVVAGDVRGNVLSWWRNGMAFEEGVDRFSVACEDGTELRFLCLDADRACLLLFFSKPAGFEVWDLRSLSKRSQRIPLPFLSVVTCFAVSRSGQGLSESNSNVQFLVGGWDEAGNLLLAECSAFSCIAQNSVHAGTVKLLSLFPLVSTPRSVDSSFFGRSRAFFLGCDDGCLSALGGGSRSAGEVVGRFGDAVLAINVDSSVAPDLTLREVFAVSVLPDSDTVVAGHEDGRLSLWHASSGCYKRSFKVESGDWVGLIAISDDQSLAVSGHRNGCALAWNTSTWDCLSVMNGHDVAVVCVSISADNSLLVTVDWDGGVLLWDSNGIALWARPVQTGLMWSDFGVMGRLNSTELRFLWASRCISRKWKGVLIDLANGNVVSEGADGSTAWEEKASHQYDACGSEGIWNLGAVFCNRMVEIPAELDRSKASWSVSSDTNDGFLVPRVDCALRLVSGAVSVEASLGFDHRIYAIAAKALSQDVDIRRPIVIVCSLRHNCVPTILHLFPTKNHGEF